MPAPTPPEEIAGRVERIRVAAMALFAANGYAATSMAAIADAAGLSRPALYQHFASREDIFRVGLEHLLTTANERAIFALHADGPLAERFDGYLQACRGDVIGPLLASPHGDELLSTRLATAADVADALHQQRRDSLARFLRDLCPGDRTRAARIAELLEMAPLGLKHDGPTIGRYRTRLTVLAEAAATLVELDPPDEVT